MKKVILTIISLLCTPIMLNAQQQPQFTHYMYNTIAVNPAYAGSRDALAINAVNRNQWAGISGAPTTTTISAHSPLRNNMMGLGISVMHDQLGYENFSFVYIDYSYSIKLKEEHILSFGLKGGFTQFSLDSELYDDPEVAADSYFDEKLNRWTPNIGAGIYYHTQKWYAGLSTPRMISTDYNKNADHVSLERNHYYMLGGYVFDLSANTKLKPSFSAKYTKGSPISAEISAHFLFYEKFWLGASYRNDDAIGGLFDMKVNKQLRIGYAYEYPVTDISKYTSGSHEIMLIYEFKFEQSKFKSPRYF